MSQDRWTDVKSRVEGLGLKLKLHLQQEADDDDAVRNASDPRSADREPGSTRAAFDDLGDRLEDAFEAFGNAAKDPAVRADVKDIGLMLKDALQETLSGVGAEVGERFRTDGGTGSAGSDPGSDSPFKGSPDDDTQDTLGDGS